MDEATLVQEFGTVYEQSPWLAEAVFGQGLGPAEASVDGLHHRLAATLASASRAQQLDLLKAHPLLAGKAARDGDLSDESTDEQRGAGLDQCSAGELQQFEQLNQAYQSRFGFPFIIAVGGLGRAQILAAFRQRLDNTPEQEFSNAMEQVNRIARLRLEAM